MFQNYLIIAQRNFTRHKLYSFINIAGLTVGLACAIFIILFVRDQLSYDRWIPGTTTLYRVEGTFSVPGQPPQPFIHIPYVIPQAMLDHIPEVAARTRLFRNKVTVLVGNRQFPEIMNSVDPNFFQVIGLPLVAGDPATALAQPNSVVISEARVRKYFGDAPALGRTIAISAKYCDEQGQNCQSQQEPLTVTGILRDLPHNTQLAADLMMPNTSKADPTAPFVKVSWLAFSGLGYVALAPGADPALVTAKLSALIDRSINPKAMGNMNQRGSQLLSPHLTRFVDDHLSTDNDSSMTPPGSWTTVYGFMAIGVLILLVACFNFTNLATARAMIRAREISLRKVVGAARRQLVAQFLGESVLTAMIALVLALALSEVLLPNFDRFLNAPIAFRYLADWSILLGIIGIAIAVGLLSGIYPALVLSGIRPAATLRSHSGRQSGSGLLRTCLVVLQFAVSIGLGIAVLVVFAQISFARHIDLGFRKDGIVLINGDNLLPKARESFVQALRANPGISDAAISDHDAVPFSGSENNVDVHRPGGLSEVFRDISVGPGYSDLYGIRLLAGRTLSDKYAGDIAADERYSAAPYNILINETAAHRLGYQPGNAVGKTVTVHASAATIVGVVADTKIQGVGEPVMPVIYRYLPTFAGQISVRVRSGQLPETLIFIDRTWHAFAPSMAIERHFLDADFGNQFLNDERQGEIFTLFVSIAIFIAALGLFGLAAFSTERRTKEIGLRKTFGARTRDIILLLLWQFSIPVLVANVIAWPVAYFYLHNWLGSYAYRISLSPLYFVGAGAAALLIAWATVIVHAAHVARAKPIHALRYE